MPYKYFGRTTSFKGKSLWEIVGNLKNYGVGRVVVRSVFERYPEPSFMKIVKVQTLPEPKQPSPDNLRKVTVTVEKTFRGEKLPRLVTIESSSYKTDYRLLSKDEESEYCKLEPKPPSEVTILPRMMKLPPLYREILVREMKSKGEEVKEPLMEVAYNKHVVRNKKSNCRLAEEGEKPSFDMDVGLGTPVTPRLYKDVDIKL